MLSGAQGLNLQLILNEKITKFGKYLVWDSAAHYWTDYQQDVIRFHVYHNAVVIQ